ncbi:hypothetical protein V6N13_053832 [Hibiscus sabdariffa]
MPHPNSSSKKTSNVHGKARTKAAVDESGGLSLVSVPDHLIYPWPTGARFLCMDSEQVTKDARAKSVTLDCNNVDKKLRQIFDLNEDEANFHMKQSAFLYLLAVRTMPKSPLWNILIPNCNIMLYSPIISLHHQL